MTFSDKIKVAREQAGLTQQQLADSTGVSKRTIASYESGGAIARASTMLKLAKALNISSKYLSDDSCLDPGLAAVGWRETGDRPAESGTI